MSDQPDFIRCAVPKGQGLAPRIVDDICRQACLQYAAGLLVTPTFIVQEARLVSSSDNTGKTVLTFRQVFSAAYQQMASESWLVTLRCAEPDDGVVGVHTLFKPAQFYVYNTAEHCWKHNFDYEHAWTDHKRLPGGDDRKVDDSAGFPDPLDNYSF